MPELEGKGVFVDLAEYYQVGSSGLLVLVEAVVHEDEVFNGGLLYPAAEVQRVGLEPVVPAGLLVPEVDDGRGLEVVETLVFRELIHVEVLHLLDVGDDCSQFPRALHAQKVALVLDVCHRHSELGPVHFIVGLQSVVVELVDGPCCVSPQLAQIGRVVLVHFLGEADVVVAADAAPLVLAEEDGALVFPHHLVQLAESALVALEVDEGVISLLQRRVDGHSPLVLVEASLAQESVHQDVVVQRLFLFLLLPDDLVDCLLLIGFVFVRVRVFLILICLFFLALLSHEDVAFFLNSNL